MYGAAMQCGMIRFTCEKYPTITYMNAQMKRLLGVTNENLRLLEYLRDNIFFMFPQEEREHFREQLDAVEQQGDVVTCRNRLTCCDGSVVAVCGWLSKIEDQEGNSEYQAVYSESIVAKKKKILIRTFGNFDVFVDGKAIHFPSKKAKEFLAILVDRRGGFVTSNEAISLLWEDACVGERMNGRLRKAVMELRRTLKEYKIGELLIRVNQESRIDLECIECDLYQYLEERDKYRQLFRGEYMSNYSWGENTLGGLMNKEE